MSFKDRQGNWQTLVSSNAICRLWFTSLDEVKLSQKVFPFLKTSFHACANFWIISCPWANQGIIRPSGQSRRANQAGESCLKKHSGLHTAEKLVIYRTPASVVGYSSSCRITKLYRLNRSLAISVLTFMRDWMPRCHSRLRLSWRWLIPIHWAFIDCASKWSQSCSQKWSKVAEKLPKLEQVARRI